MSLFNKNDESTDFSSIEELVESDWKNFSFDWRALIAGIEERIADKVDEMVIIVCVNYIRDKVMETHKSICSYVYLILITQVRFRTGSIDAIFANELFCELLRDIASIRYSERFMTPTIQVYSHLVLFLFLSSLPSLSSFIIDCVYVPSDSTE